MIRGRAMKTAIIFLLALASLNASATIRNGYERDVAYVDTEIILTKRALIDAVGGYRRTLTCKLAHLEALKVSYDYTARMLDQFRAIAPDIYNELDNLRDAKGRPVDVYVRFVNRREMPPGVMGWTNISQNEADPHAYQSPYGLHTVEVQIAIINSKSMFTSMFTLAHELGHVAYQVPNLNTYMEYYRTHYISESEGYGHNMTDLSGEASEVMERRFSAAYKAYMKTKRSSGKSFF